MAEQNEPGPAQAWDRVGRWFEDMARVGEVVVKRNLKMWTTVSQNLRQRDKYGADEMARDAATVLGAMLDNLDDIWTSVTRPPEREEVAVNLPTVFLHYSLKPPARHGDPPAYALTGPAWIRVPLIDLDGLADTAAIYLEDAAGVAPLRRRLTGTKVARKGYKIEDTDTGEELTAGFYAGIVYVTDPVRPLASLRIVVQEP
jgi:hypothetical protein